MPALHPLLCRWAESEPLAAGEDALATNSLPGSPFLLTGKQVQEDSAAMASRKKIPSGRKYSKPLFKEIIKLLSDGRGRVSHPLEREMPLAHEMMPLAFHSPQVHDLWLGKVFSGIPVLKLVPEEYWPVSDSGLLILPGLPPRNLWEVRKIPAVV